MKHIMTSYVSELDQFLTHLNKTCSPTKSQQLEIKKAKCLSLLRDGVSEKLESKSSLWEGF